MNKYSLREIMKLRRAEIVDRQEKDFSIAEKVIAHTVDCNSVFVYVSFGNEVNTVDLIVRLIGSGKKVCIPYTNNGSMSVKILPFIPDDFRVDKRGNLFGADKLADADFECDCAIIPMIAFNSRLFRIGYGGGYYDRYLVAFSGTKIGVAYDEQFCEEFVQDSYDVGLDMIITPTEILRGDICE